MHTKRKSLFYFGIFIFSTAIISIINFISLAEYHYFAFCSIESKVLHEMLKKLIICQQMALSSCQLEKKLEARVVQMKLLVADEFSPAFSGR